MEDVKLAITTLVQGQEKIAALEDTLQKVAIERDRLKVSLRKMVLLVDEETPLSSESESSRIIEEAKSLI